MDKKNENPTENNAPIEALCEVLDYLWADELKSYCEEPTEGHIFYMLVLVANWLSGCDWHPAGYQAAWRVMPEMGWRVAGIANKALPPESLLPRLSDEPEAEWAWEGYGSRYRIQGRKASVRVIVGWDRPLSTYIAQVWDILDGGTQHEQGRLLHWVGMSFEEVPDVEDLADSIAPFVTMPSGLRERLEADMRDPESCMR